jgi:hypothetical protein
MERLLTGQLLELSKEDKLQFLQNLQSYAKPALTIFGLFVGCSTGLMYLKYLQQEKKFEEHRQKYLRGLEMKMIEENQDFKKYEKVMFAVKERIVVERELGLLSKDTMKLLFEAFFFLMKDSTQGFGYQRIVEGFRRKRRELLQDFVDSLQKIELKNLPKFLNKIDADFEEYNELCSLETSVLAKATTNSLRQILKKSGISKKLFDKSFLKLGELDLEIRQIMKTTFTKLSSTIKASYYQEIRQSYEGSTKRVRKEDITGDLLLKILEYRITIYPELKMFNTVPQPMRKYSRLKFMSDLIFFVFGVEDEDMYLDSNDPKMASSSQYKLNPKLRAVARKIQSLLQTNF